MLAGGAALLVVDDTEPFGGSLVFVVFSPFLLCVLRFFIVELQRAVIDGAVRWWSAIENRKWARFCQRICRGPKLDLLYQCGRGVNSLPRTTTAAFSPPCWAGPVLVAGSALFSWCGERAGIPRNEPRLKASWLGRLRKLAGGPPGIVFIFIRRMGPLLPRPRISPRDFGFLDYLYPTEKTDWAAESRSDSGLVALKKLVVFAVGRCFSRGLTSTITCRQIEVCEFFL